MKKVLFTATVDSHILQFHLPYLKLFKEKGYEVHVATNGTEEIPYCDIKHVVNFERNPLKINNLKAIKQLKKIINKEKFDIIHTHTPMGSVVTRLAAKKARKKFHTRVIYTAHGFHFFKGAPLKNWFIFYPVEKYLSKYTDTLILINQEDYNLAKKKFKKRCRDIEYVPGVGIDEKKFSFEMSDKEKTELRKSLGLNQKDFVIIYPAELNKNKNQLMIINVVEELIKKYKNIKLLLPGVDSYRGHYQNIVKNRKLEKNVIFLGYRNDIPKLLKIANLAVSTSCREGLPLNVIESMYMGLPVVGTNCRGQRDLIENNCNGFVVAINDIDNFCSSIEKLYLSKEVYMKFKKANKRIAKEYSLDIVKKQLNRIYFKKKKVIHLLSSCVYSGAENIACFIINELNSNYDLTYCSPNGKIADALQKFGIKYIPLSRFSYFKIKKIVNDIRPEIIHAHDNKSTVFASMFHRKCTIISHIHGNNRIMNNANLKTILFNICSKHISKFIWVSQSSFKGYYFHKRIENKSIILPNVINDKIILTKSNEYEEKNEYDIIFLGRIGFPKNPERLIRIINIICNTNNSISVAIVGDGEEKNKIVEIVNESKLKDNIKFFGFLSNPYPVLKKSKILIMTSIYEGTPMCALEAQLLGKPIVATPVDGLLDIVDNGYNGYLSNDDNVFALKVLHILKDENYNFFSKNSIKKFNDINNMEKYIMTIKRIYERE